MIIILTGLFILLKPGQENMLSSFLPPPVYRIRIMIILLILALKTILNMNVYARLERIWKDFNNYLNLQNELPLDVNVKRV